MITKRRCRRLAHQQHERGLRLRSQSDRTDIDLHEAFALDAQADIAFEQARELWALAAGPVRVRLKVAVQP